MAIQDETDYTLKGKQVKKIVQEIKESGTTYSAGTGLELTGTTFSVDNTIATKSEIPTVNNATLTIQKNSTSAGTFTANSATDTTINITVPVTAADVSALPVSTKYAANLSLTIDSSTYVVTGQLKDQDGNNLGSAQTIDLPLESVVVSGSYDSTNKKIILTLQSGQTIDVPVGDLVSGLQTEITSSNKLSADLVDDSTTTNKFVTATDKTTWSGKQNALTAGSNITISGDTISATDTTYSDFVGATSGDAGTHGLVPAPASGDTDKYLKSDGSWATVSSYTLPAASANTLGGVKIGSNLSMDANDVLSATDTTYTAGTNVTISSGNVISATDTTYSNFVGTDGTAAGTAGLVPAPATTDAGKVLKADGTWAVPEGGIKTLTAADYDYPDSGTKTSVALWRLPRGIYEIPAGVAARTSTSGSVTSDRTGSIIAVINQANQTNITLFGSGYYGMWSQIYVTSPLTGIKTSFDNSRISSNAILTSEQVVDNLTTDSSVTPLSAKQGSVLNSTINARVKTNAGAPTTSTTGTKGQLLEDTTNGNLYICTNSASPYAWKQIDKDEILTNAGAPTTSTAGTLGQLLTDTTNAKLYQLTAIDTTDPQNPSYTWTEVGGSSGPTVVQTTGTSTTDVMSQNAVTGMIYGDATNGKKIRIGNSRNVSDNSVVIGNATETYSFGDVVQIGNGTYASYAPGVIIGNNASITNRYGVAIGDHAHVTKLGGVALGAYANATTDQGQFDIGTTQTSYGYNSSNYRLLTGLYDPQAAHDAATKGYADTKATITMTTTDPGEGAATTANTLTAVYS